NRSGQIHQ
ncbi:3-octaprenyl-4-hydroxybenzoate carboxy-lyase family protein, partial [Vibrio parahaemolyticus VP2007-007]